jgi:lipid A 3-O-deacylase
MAAGLRTSGGAMTARARRATKAAVFGAFAAALLTSVAARAEDPSYVAVGAGVYDVLHNYTAGQARLEFRFGQRWFFLKPMVGVLATTDKSVMGYFGFRFDLYLGQHVVVTPNAAVGAFYRGDGKQLGSTIEFKTGGEFAWRFDDHSRLGLQFDHISNAGIGKHNPGTESLVLYYSIPIGGPTH